MSVNATDALQIARRYTTAIFSLALEAKKEAAVVAEMHVLAQAITANANLRETLENPIVTHAQKAAVLSALVAKGCDITKNAIHVVAQGGRADLLVIIAEQLQEKLAAHQGKIDAVIVSARALPASTQKQLAQSLAKATGKDVQLTLREDPSVLGGLSIQLGSLRLDVTLANALTTLREQLLAPTH